MQITYISNDDVGIKEGYVVLGIGLINKVKKGDASAYKLIADILDEKNKGR